MSAVDYRRWVRFLAQPHLRPQEELGFDGIGRYAQLAWQRTLESAIEHGVLTQQLLLAQFAHFGQQDSVDWDIATAVDTDHAVTLLKAAGTLASFVKSSEISFFRRSALRLGERGLICHISGSSPKEPPHCRSDEYDTYAVRLSSEHVYSLPSLTLDYQRSVVGRVTGSSLVLVRFQDVLSFISGLSGAQPLSSAATLEFTLPQEIAPCFGDTATQQQSYMAHLSPLAGEGHVVLCVPLNFADAPGTHVDAFRTTGGCLFLLAEAPDSVALDGIYLVTRRFCNAVAMLFDHAHRVSQTEVARGAYAVGHPLGHRLRGAAGALNDLGISLRDSDVATARVAFPIAYEDVKTCHRVAQLMHLMSNVLTFGADRLDVHDEKTAFYKYGSPFVIAPWLEKCGDACMRLGIGVRFTPSRWWQCIGDACISGMWLATVRGRARFLDALYEELFFETVLNAARWGTKPDCELEVGVEELPTVRDETRLAIVLSNSCNSQPLRRSEVGEWLPWNSDSRHEGGLRFLADCLRATKSGGLSIRQDRVGGSWTYRTRFELHGLERTTPERNND